MRRTDNRLGTHRPGAQSVALSLSETLSSTHLVRLLPQGEVYSPAHGTYGIFHTLNVWEHTLDIAGCPDLVARSAVATTSHAHGAPAYIGHLKMKRASDERSSVESREVEQRAHRLEVAQRGQEIVLVPG